MLALERKIGGAASKQLQLIQAKACSNMEMPKLQGADWVKLGQCHPFFQLLNRTG